MRRLVRIGAGQVWVLSIGAPLVHAQPINDDCVEAPLVQQDQSFSVRVQGTTIGATPTPELADGLEDVWFRYVPKEHGTTEIELIDGLADLTLSIWTPSPTGPVPCGATQLGLLTFGFSFDADPAQVYFIRVSAPNPGETGDFALVLSQTYLAPTCNDAIESQGVDDWFRGTTDHAVADPATSCLIPADSYGFWVRYTAPEDGHALFRAREDEAQTDPVPVNLAVYTECAASILACDVDEVHWPVQAGEDYYVRVSMPDGSQRGFDYRLVSSVPGDICAAALPLPLGFTLGTTEGASTDAFSCTPVPLPYSIWYRFQAPSDGRLSVSASPGDEFNSFGAIGLYGTCGGSLIACNNTDIPPGSNAALAYDMLAGEQVRIAVVANFTTGIGDVVPTAYSLGASFVPVAADCADAVAIPLGDTLAPAIIHDATDAVIPVCAPDATPTKPAWFRWTAAQTGRVLFEPELDFRANLDNAWLVSVYDACGGTELACGEQTARLDTVQGTEYLVRAAIPATDPGDPMTLFIRDVPVNDECDDATDLGAGYVTTTFQTDSATPSGPDEITCGDTFNDVWFLWQSNTNGIVAFDTSGFGAGHTLLVYEDTPCTQLTLKACANLGVQGDDLLLNVSLGERLLLRIAADTQGFGTPGTSLTIIPRCDLTELGPSPYLQRSDSPFDGIPGIQLDDFEDTTPRATGVSYDSGRILNPGSSTDSVDADDGAIDGTGNGGHSYWSGFPNSDGVNIAFDPVALGGYPTHVGIVATDGGTVAGTIVQFIDPAGDPVATFGPIQSSGTNGSTDTDRFVGVICDSGIASILATDTFRAFELDHLWVGTPASPPCPADLNGDGILDNGDIGTFVAFFLAGNLAADLNGDGILDNGDIGAFVAAFLAGC